MQRTLSLDVFRGLAIIGMILSGSVPYNGILPAWMYHAQVPPPTFAFNPYLPGITWVDLVFPFFLFAMGVAIPLAYQQKPLPKTFKEYATTFGQIFKRGFLLVGFALALQHCKPLVQSSTPIWFHQSIAIIGFFLMFLVLTTLPKQSIFPPSIVRSIRIIALIILTGILAWNTYRGQAFSFERSDIIIIVLANVSVSGTILWLLTRNNHLLRVGMLGFLLAFRLTQNEFGSWNHLVWFATPAPWMYKLYFHQYLFLVLPGTMIGDYLVQSQLHHKSTSNIERPTSALWFVTSILLGIITTNVVLLYARWLVPNLCISVIIVILLAYIMNRIQYNAQSLHKKIINLGGDWLLLGLTLEAFEAGIKKDKSTLSYYAVTAGLACYSIVACSLLVDCLQQANRFRLIIHTGQNPMIAYVAGSLLLGPLLSLTGMNSLLAMLQYHPVLAFIKGALITVGVMLVTSLCTRYKLFWKT